MAVGSTSGRDEVEIGKADILCLGQANKGDSRCGMLMNNDEGQERHFYYPYCVHTVAMDSWVT